MRIRSSSSAAAKAFVAASRYSWWKIVKSRAEVWLAQVPCILESLLHLLPACTSWVSLLEMGLKGVAN